MKLRGNGRKELEELVAVNETRKKTEQDFCIPYDLEQIWTVDAMDELKEERFFHEKNNLLPILESIDKDLEERENRDEHESDPYA